MVLEIPAVWGGVGRSINSKRGKEPKAGADGLIKRKSGPQAMHQQPQVGGPRKLPGPPCTCHVGLAGERLESLAVAVPSVDNPPFPFCSLLTADGSSPSLAGSLDTEDGFLEVKLDHRPMRSMAVLSSAGEHSLSYSARSDVLIWTCHFSFCSFEEKRLLLVLGSCRLHQKSVV